MLILHIPQLSAPGPVPQTFQYWQVGNASEPKESETDHEQFVLNLQDYTIVIYFLFFLVQLPYLYT